MARTKLSIVFLRNRSVRSRRGLFCFLFERCVIFWPQSEDGRPIQEFVDFGFEGNYFKYSRNVKFLFHSKILIYFMAVIHQEIQE